MARSRRGRIWLTGAAAVAAIAVAACGSSSTGATKPQAKSSLQGAVQTTNSDEIAAKYLPQPTTGTGTITTFDEAEPSDFNFVTANDYSQQTGQVIDAIWPSPFLNDPNLDVYLNTDLLTSATLTSKSPETVVYKINPKAVWSDGVPISADDFIYYWTVSNGKDTKYEAISSSGYSQMNEPVSSDGGKTVTVTFTKPYADWKSLFPNLLPAHYMKTLAPDPHDAFNKGLNPPAYPKISGGPFIISSFKPDQSITMMRNPKWWGKPVGLDTVVWRIVSDESTEPQAFQNNEVQAVYPLHPTADFIQNAQRTPNITTELGKGVIFEHIDLNAGNTYLKDPVLRRAILMATNRNEILEAAVKQIDPNATPLNNRLLVPGQAGYTDDMTKYGLGSGNTAAAMKVLTDAGYTVKSGHLFTKAGVQVPAFQMKYKQESDLRATESRILQASVKPLGITVDLVPGDQNKFLPAKQFDITVFGWSGTPFPFSSATAIYISKQNENYNNVADPIVDTAMTAAANELDPVKATADLNTADNELSKMAYSLPLYQSPVYLAYSKKYTNIFANGTTLGFSWNIQDWGLSTHS